MTSSEVTPLMADADATTTTTTGSNNNNTTRQPQLDLQRARYFLYTSHFFAQFSQQSWEFSLTLFLAAYTNYQNVMFVSSYGIVTALLIFTMGSSAGRYFVDDIQWDRLSATRCLVWAQNGCVIIATLLTFALLQLPPSSSLSPSSTGTARSHTDFVAVACMVGLHIFGPLSTMLDKAFLVSIERDWVVVMGEYARQNNLPSNTGTTGSNGTNNTTGTNKETTWLYETNVTMKQIDLTCRIAAPALAGLTIGMVEEAYRYHNHNSAVPGVVATNNNHIHTSSDHLAFTALLIGLLNGIALIVEYICTFVIYQLIPTLAIKRPRIIANTASAVPTSSSSATATSVTIPYKPSNVNDQPQYSNMILGFCGYCRDRLYAPSGLRIYLTQPISWAGISLSLLYFNTLTFGGLMTAYLLWRGMTLETVGFWRGVSSALGLAGTFAFRVSTKRMSLVATGMWSIIHQLVCILVSVTSFFVASYNLSMTLLIFGVCTSRIGLWVFDVAVTQLMQQFIPEGIRGSVGGTQNALNALFQLSSFSLGFFLPSPEQFKVYAFFGCISVSVAASIYLAFVFRHCAKFEPN